MYKQISILLISCAMIACTSNENEFKNKRHEILFSAESPSTRASMESGFNNGDSIGIYMTAQTPTGTKQIMLNEKCSKQNGNQWKLQNRHYWEDETSPSTVIAYYPYRNNQFTQKLSLLPVSASSDQSTEEKLRHTDFLYTKIEGLTYNQNHEKITLEMKHKLPKVVVNLNLPEESFNSDIMMNVINIKRLGTINLASGEILTDLLSDGNITPYINKKEKTAEFFLVPQKLGNQLDLFTIEFTNNGVKELYAYKLENEMTLLSGGIYTINFTPSNNQ